MLPNDVSRLARLTPTYHRTLKAGIPGATVFCRARMERALPILIESNRIGLQIAEAAGRLGYEDHTVRHWIRRLGIVWQNTNGRTVYKYDQKTWFVIVEPLLKEGMTNSEILKRLNKKLGAKVSLPTIGRFILNNGLRACRRDSSR